MQCQPFTDPSVQLRSGQRERPKLVLALRLKILTFLLPAALGLALPALAATDASDVAESVDPTAFEQKPRWEFGVGGGYFKGHDYPASDDPNERALAVPFFIYRSPVLRVGDGGIRAVAIENPRVKLDLSIGGSLSAQSEGNSARAGMPALDYLFELGPQLRISLTDRPTADGGRLQLAFAAKFRAVVATDFSGLYAQGFVTELGVRLARRQILGSKIDLIANADVTFADERLQDYYYEVSPRFVNEQRPEFDASGGYLGAQVFLGVAYRPTSAVRLFAGVVQGFFAGAANEDSPLFETTGSTGLAIGFAWTIARSRQTVSVIDVE